MTCKPLKVNGLRTVPLNFEPGPSPSSGRADGACRSEALFHYMQVQTKTRFWVSGNST